MRFKKSGKYLLTFSSFYRADFLSVGIKKLTNNYRFYKLRCIFLFRNNRKNNSVVENLISDKRNFHLPPENIFFYFPSNIALIKKYSNLKYWLASGVLSGFPSYMTLVAP